MFKLHQGKTFNLLFLFHSQQISEIKLNITELQQGVDMEVKTRVLSVTLPPQMCVGTGRRRGSGEGERVL